MKKCVPARRLYYTSSIPCQNSIENESRWVREAGFIPVWISGGPACIFSTLAEKVTKSDATVLILKFLIAIEDKLAKLEFGRKSLHSYGSRFSLSVLLGNMVLGFSVWC